MRTNQYIFIALISTLTAACSSASKDEYFCEYKRIGLGNDPSLYYQTSVKVNNSEICIYHRGQDYCVEYGKSINGYIDNTDWDKNIKHSEIYTASHDGQNYTFKVFSKNQLQDGVDVDSNLINNEWHFSFKGKKLKPTLPSKLTTNESMSIFKLAAIENQTYGYAQGEFVSKASPPKKFSDPFEEEINNILGSDREVVFYYESEKYKKIKELVNGSYLDDIYTFNKNDMLLISTPTNPFKMGRDDGIYRYQCEAWKKQRWYEFP